MIWLLLRCCLNITDSIFLLYHISYRSSAVFNLCGSNSPPLAVGRFISIRLCLFEAHHPQGETSRKGRDVCIAPLIVAERAGLAGSAPDQGYAAKGEP
jgi:hypothetical protein